jgi:hypothetical protein
MGNSSSKIHPAGSSPASVAGGESTRNNLTPEAALKEGEEFFRQFALVREGKSAGDSAGTSLQDAAYAATILAVAAEEVVVGLLSVGKIIPIVGSAAGAALMFYDRCKAVGDNMDGLEELKKATTDGSQ